MPSMLGGTERSPSGRCGSVLCSADGCLPCSAASARSVATCSSLRTAFLLRDARSSSSSTAGCCGGGEAAGSTASMAAPARGRACVGRGPHGGAGGDGISSGACSTLLLALGLPASGPCLGGGRGTGRGASAAAASECIGSAFSRSSTCRLPSTVACEKASRSSLRTVARLGRGWGASLASAARPVGSAPSGVLAGAKASSSGASSGARIGNDA
mmetsp:Transcript_112685/g.329308  ORF Transcript_112685/g.329308 Transcript_112685/m.329308 type:complete len:214 (+) Transcript_112685:538-1179(+)